MSIFRVSCVRIHDSALKFGIVSYLIRFYFDHPGFNSRSISSPILAIRWFLGNYHCTFVTIYKKARSLRGAVRNSLRPFVEGLCKKGVTLWVNNEPPRSFVPWLISRSLVTAIDLRLWFYQKQKVLQNQSKKRSQTPGQGRCRLPIIVPKP